jgi:hypothetical protein
MSGVSWLKDSMCDLPSSGKEFYLQESQVHIFATLAAQKGGGWVGEGN